MDAHYHCLSNFSYPAFHCISINEIMIMGAYRQCFDLLTKRGWRNCYLRGFDLWALKHILGDIKCLFLRHKFDLDFGGKKQCSRCSLVRE
jgi:hypothetical protein